jgi:hypothetical protein
MKKKIVCFLVFLCCYVFCTAQQVISAGGYAVKSEVSVNWILGGNLLGIPSIDISTLNKTGTEGLTESLLALKVYPNPTSDFLNIEITPVDTGRLVLELYDNSGVKVLNKTSDYQPILQLNVTDIPSGFYLLKVFFPCNTQIIGIGKIIKK